MTKTCAQCGSAEVEEFKVELSIARPESTPVYAFGTIVLCSACGFGECLIPEAALARLRGCNSNGPRC